MAAQARGGIAQAWSINRQRRVGRGSRPRTQHREPRLWLLALALASGPPKAQHEVLGKAEASVARRFSAAVSTIAIRGLNAHENREKNRHFARMWRFFLRMSKKSCTFASGKLLFTHSEQYRMAQ